MKKPESERAVVQLTLWSDPPPVLPRGLSQSCAEALAPSSRSAHSAQGPRTEGRPATHPNLSKPQLNSGSNLTPRTFSARKLKSSFLTQKLFTDLYATQIDHKILSNTVKCETSESFLMDKDDSKPFTNLLIMIIVANSFPLARMCVSIWNS